MAEFFTKGEFRLLFTEEKVGEKFIDKLKINVLTY